MNNKGINSVMGFSLVLLVFLFLVTMLATWEPLKETFNTARGTSSLNCRDTVNFNQTAYDLDTGNEIKTLTRRPTCFITGLGLVWYVGAFTLAVFAWLARNWRKG